MAGRAVKMLLDVRSCPDSENTRSLLNWSFETSAEVPGFEDYNGLFATGYITRGIVDLTIQEAAYIWKSVKTQSPNVLVEIGRWLGGSTVLIAGAKNQGAKFFSLDLKDYKDPARPFVADHFDDKLVENYLAKISDSNTTLLVENSRTYQVGEPVEWLFIDGDHSYEGVQHDLKNWMPQLSDGASILFHDSADTGDPHTPFNKGAQKAVKELLQQKDVQHIASIGSITHVKVKRNAATLDYYKNLSV